MDLLPSKASYEKLIIAYEAARDPNTRASNEAIERAGVELVAFEAERKIPDVRNLLAEERRVKSRLEVYRQIVDRFEMLTASNERFISSLASGEIDSSELEKRSRELESQRGTAKLAKEVVAKLENRLGKIEKEKTSLPKSVLADARRGDPFTESERLMFEELHKSSRFGLATIGAFDQANKQEPVTV